MNMLSIRNAAIELTRDVNGT